MRSVRPISVVTSPTSRELFNLALEMKEAQDSAQQLEPFTARFPWFDLPAAYKVADFVHCARLKEGAKPIGRKIGFSNRDMWSKYGVHTPIWAHIYNTTVAFLTDTRTTCPLGRFTEPKIEPEIVIQFHSTPRAGAGIVDIVKSIGWIAHGFEIVQSHFPGWKFEAADTVADWALHGMLLIGPLRPLAQIEGDLVAALEFFTLTLSCNGKPMETGRGSNVLGNPIGAVVDLISVLARQPHCDYLQAGEIVTTGTITTAHSVRAGEIWQSELHGIGLPGLTVEFLM